MSNTSRAARAPQTIATPFALFAFVLDRLGETEPMVRVDASSHARFQRTLDRIRALDGDTLPAATLLNGLHLEKASRSTINTVLCGAALLGELRSHRQAIWGDDFDVKITIESLVVSLLQAWMKDPDRDPFIHVDFTDEHMLIRSRPALTRRYGMRIDVEMSADCLG